MYPAERIVSGRWRPKVKPRDDSFRRVRRRAVCVGTSHFCSFGFCRRPTFESSLIQKSRISSVVRPLSYECPHPLKVFALASRIRGPHTVRTSMGKAFKLKTRRSSYSTSDGDRNGDNLSLLPYIFVITPDLGFASSTPNNLP